ncbi:MAG: Hpt domain-containing protein, partial [Gemmatimonadaceae bacterium]
MASSPELLRYFVAEARECLDALEPLVAKVMNPSDGSSVVSAARALRGTATIARLSRIADLAFAIERVGGAIRDSELASTPELRDALWGAVKELRGVVSSAQSWGEAEDARVAAADLSVRRFVPNASRPTPTMPSSATRPVFVALQASAIASDLDEIIQATDRRQVLDEVLSRVRIMQGVAGLQEYPPLAEVCDAIERAARGTVPDASLTAAETELFSSAAAVLRRSSDQLRARTPLDANSQEVQRFAQAVAAIEPSTAPQELVVQIEELFYHDAGPHVLTRASAPPVTPERRFADEVVSRAEHVKRLIGDARSAGDGIGRQRIRRELATTLQALETTAQSFGAAQVAALCGDASRRADLLSSLELEALDTAVTLMLRPADSIEEMERRMAILTRRQNTPHAGQRSTIPGAATRVPPVTPTGRALHEFLSSGIAGLRGLNDQPFAERDASPTDDDVVPVES